MWDSAITWSLGVLAIASSAGLLASRSARSLRRLRAEAELLAILPPGEARDGLDAHVSSGVGEYLFSQEYRAGNRLLLRLAGAGQVVGTACVFVVIVRAPDTDILDLRGAELALSIVAAVLWLSSMAYLVWETLRLHLGTRKLLG